MATNKDKAELENYIIHSDGKIYSKINNKFLKLKSEARGYSQVTLCNKTKKNFLVHRLVAQAFIPNPENKPCVNHINGIKSDNRVENLEWCTHSENEKHSYKILRKKANTPTKGKFGKLHHNSKKIKQMDKDFNLIKIWDSFSDITRELGIAASNLHKACNGIYHTSGGFIWRYA